jgi:hypothetical protein
VKLLLDEMWSPTIAIELRRRGHDVEAVPARSDLRSTPDDTVYAAAIAEDRVLLTENVPDFRRRALRRLDEGTSHPGLVFAFRNSFRRGDRGDIGRLVRALDALMKSGEDLTDRELWL